MIAPGIIHFCVYTDHLSGVPHSGISRGSGCIRAVFYVDEDLQALASSTQIKIRRLHRRLSPHGWYV